MFKNREEILYATVKITPNCWNTLTICYGNLCPYGSKLGFLFKLSENLDPYYKSVLQDESRCFGLFRWLVNCFGFNDPLRQYFSLNRAVSQRVGVRREKR